MATSEKWSELGRDFCYDGSQYPIPVGGPDFALDLLFFNRALNCLVAIELKVVEFEPEHLGKLQFYLEALDRDVKKPLVQPSIGVYQTQRGTVSWLGPQEIGLSDSLKSLALCPAPALLSLPDHRRRFFLIARDADSARSAYGPWNRGSFPISFRDSLSPIAIRCTGRRGRHLRCPYPPILRGRHTHAPSSNRSR